MSTASLASTTPYWGRAYTLTVYNTPDGSGSPGVIISSSAWEPEALRITFDVHQTALPSPWWFADISVYNYDDNAMSNALTSAQWVTLSAGYQSIGNQQVIWSGAVMQVLLTREDVVDIKLTFHCFATDPRELRRINFNQAQNTSQATTVAAMLIAISGHVIAPLPPGLSDTKYLRGKVVFGNVDKYFGQLADTYNMTWFKAPKGYAIGPLDSGTNTPAYTYSPPLPANWAGGAPSVTTSYTLIGTPQQTDCGVEFSVLLDPRLKVQMPPLLVALNNVVIAQLVRQFPQGPFMPLAQDGQYVVAEVHHRGDTRGNLWQTDVRGFTRAWTQNALRGIFLTGV
jgi:hypothetical protein